MQSLEVNGAVRPLYESLGVKGLNHSGFFIYHQIQHPQIIRSSRTVYLCALYGSQNEQRLFPYTPLIDWFL